MSVCPKNTFYRKKIDGFVEGEKAKADPNHELNPEYPRNYVNGILENIDKYQYLVIPSDWLVLAYVEDKGVPYILCYPESSAKEEYQKRYLQRGNTEYFLDVFIGGWDKFMETLRSDTYGAHIVLKEKEYLLDAKDLIDGIISHGIKMRGAMSQLYRLTVSKYHEH